MYPPLRTERDYRIAVAEMDRIFDAEPGSPECERLRGLSLVVAEYEARQGGDGEDDPSLPWLPTDPEEAAEAMVRSLLMEREGENGPGA